MAKCRFYYNNLWLDAVTLNWSSRHPHFPAANTQHRWPTRSWHSRHGAGSGWGLFTITVNVNDRIDFEETIGVNLVANITVGLYDVDTLCAEIKTQLEIAGASTYTIEYIETGANELHFRFTSNGAGGGGVFRLMWNTGPNAARSIGDTCGFDVTADDVGALVYLADYIRIHTEEWVSVDLGAANTVQGAIIKGHNLQNTALCQIWGDNNPAFPAGIKLQFTIQDDILVLLWDPGYFLRYWRFYIEDVDNPAGYVELGCCFLGPHFAPLRNFHFDRIQTQMDPSLIKYSEGGQISTLQRTHFFMKDYFFQHTDQKAQFDLMFNEMGSSKGFFMAENPDHPLTRTNYLRFVEWEWTHFRVDFWDLIVSVEELR